MIASKTPQSSFLFTGSTAAGKVPPSFNFLLQQSLMIVSISDLRLRNSWQVSGKALDVMRSKFFIALLDWMTKVKGGMDKEEFEKHLLISIVPLYPDSLDVMSNWVAIKLNSGLGRMKPDMMSHSCLQGFYIYPGVTNTTTVTQKVDRQYSPMKTKFYIDFN